MNEIDKAHNLRCSVFKLLGLAMVTVFLIGGFAVTPSYGKGYTEVTKFTEDFETSTVPACSEIIEVFLSGTAKFVTRTTYGPDGEVKHIESKTKSHATGVDIEGNNWKSNEIEIQTLDVKSNGDQIFLLEAHAKIINLGPGDYPSTIVNIHQVTILHPDGTTTTVKDKVDVDCKGQPGEP
jgi:hypothetical protein